LFQKISELIHLIRRVIFHPFDYIDWKINDFKMTKPLSAGAYATFLITLMIGCDSNPADEESLDLGLERYIVSESLILNPTGYVPLAAELTLETSEPVMAELEIESLTESGDPLIHRFSEFNTSLTLPVLGLYPSHRNTIHLRFYDRQNQLLGQEMRFIDTPDILPELPTIKVNVNTTRKKQGMNLVSYFGHTNPQLPFMFDEYGHIRWYANMATHPTLKNLFYDAGVERLQNGNLYFGDGNSGRLIEMDMFGRVIHEWLLHGYTFHHNVLELPSGNLLATVSRNDISTIEDHIVEIDRNSGIIANIWDLRISLDQRRRVWSSNSRDWFHANGLTFDPSADAIIVSGRHQGTIKLTRDNQVIWILSPHRRWGLAGDGTNLTSKLLQPLDAKGSPITDIQVLEGFIPHDEFSWSWYQHAPKFTSRGTLFQFDNGENRYYQREPVFSRAVEYAIDDDTMTIQQIWEYGRGRGRETYSAIVSDVDYHAEENTVAFMPGANFVDGANGKTVELDYVSKDVVYEAEIRRDSETPYGIMFHRIERLPIYHSNH